MEKVIIDEETGIAINRAMECDNGRMYIYCYQATHWKEVAICKATCLRHSSCDSFRLHVDKRPIIHRRTKRQIQKDREAVAAL